MAKKNRRQLPDDKSSPISTAAAAYWDELRPQITSSALFVDASAILDCFDLRFQDRTLDFLEREARSYRLFTTTYVVAEIARRLITKVSQYHFSGPNGEKYTELAIYAIKDFIAHHNIKTVCVPEIVFELGKINLEINRNRPHLEGWSLTDAITYEIIKGLEHNQILSQDNGFLHFGIMLLPHPRKY